MKKNIVLFAATLLMLTACSSPWGNKGQEADNLEENSSTSQENTQQEEQDVVAQQEKEDKCENSGGDYKNGTCSCPTDTYGSGNTPIFTYNAKTGYCEDPDGAPGGVLGEDGKGSLLDPKGL